MKDDDEDERVSLGSTPLFSFTTLYCIYEDRPFAPGEPSMLFVLAHSKVPAQHWQV